VSAGDDSAKHFGRYEVVRHLASGGMAQIYLARLTGIGGFERYVALKTIRGERARDPAAVTMLLDEARLVAALHHHNIAQVHEVGVAGDAHYLVMEYVHGETARSLLERALERDARLPLAVSLAIVASAAAGLHHAHECTDGSGEPLGIVHRDVSPSNILIGYDGAVKLIDFGIARAEQRQTETQTGILKGKSGYMSPEQCRCEPVDRRSDIFALGIVLYELTTLARAFRGINDYETMQRIVRGHLPPPSRLVPGYPQELEALVLRALAPDPDSRFATAAALHEELDAIAGRLGGIASPATVGRYLSGLFGQRPEPWRSGAPEPVELDAESGSLADVFDAQEGRRRGATSGSSVPLRMPPELAARAGWSGPGEPETSPQAPASLKPPQLPSQGEVAGKPPRVMDRLFDRSDLTAGLAETAERTAPRGLMEAGLLPPPPRSSTARALPPTPTPPPGALPTLPPRVRRPSSARPAGARGRPGDTRPPGAPDSAAPQLAVGTAPPPAPAPQLAQTVREPSRDQKTEETILLLDQRHQRRPGRDTPEPAAPSPLTPSLLAVPPRGTPPFPLPPESFLSGYPDKSAPPPRHRWLRRIALVGVAAGLGVVTAFLLGYGREATDSGAPLSTSAAASDGRTARRNYGATGSAGSAGSAVDRAGPGRRGGAGADGQDDRDEQDDPDDRDTPGEAAAASSGEPAGKRTAGAVSRPGAALVDVRVESVPAGATVVLDGVRLGKTPFIGRVPRVGSPDPTLKLRRRGYKTTRVPVDAGGPVDVRVTLHPESGS
jgi:serine/threonine protein kinase